MAADIQLADGWPNATQCSGKGDYGSVISALESEDGYPPVVRLGSNGLKITKSDFRAKLEEMIQLRKIA